MSAFDCLKSTANVKWCSTTHVRKQFKLCTKNGINGDGYCGKFFPTGQCHKAFFTPGRGVLVSKRRSISVCVPKKCEIDDSELVKEIM